MSLSRIAKLAKSHNQNTYRLTDLAPLASLPADAQEAIRELLSSKGDRAHHAAGVFLWALLTHKNPILLVSLDDMNKLIQKASQELPEGTFDISSNRGKKTIYSQFTGFLITKEVTKIILPSKGNKPGIMEVIDCELLAYLKQATDELRTTVLQSVHGKTTRLQENKSSILQDNNTNETTRLQYYKTTRLQYYKTTRHSETQDESQDETQNETQNETQDSSGLIDIEHLDESIIEIEAKQRLKDELLKLELIPENIERVLRHQRPTVALANEVLAELNLGKAARNWGGIRYIG